LPIAAGKAAILQTPGRVGSNGLEPPPFRSPDHCSGRPPACRVTGRRSPPHQIATGRCAP